MNKHIPVMLSEVIRYLNIKKDGLYIDATLGEGGYSEAIAKKLGKNGKILAIDASLKSIEYAKANVSKYLNKIIFVHDNFKNIVKIANDHGFDEVDGVVYDLGLASWQLEDMSLGISFKADENLDMRIFDESKYPVADVVNKFSVKEIANILYKYADVKKSWAVARKIEMYRRNKKIETNKNLVEAVGTKNEKYLAPIFQALRIYVNNEIKNLEISLKEAMGLLKNNARVVVVSFHSGEDRVVKNVFREEKKINNKIKILTKKPIIASEDEIRQNKKSRSAKLRAMTIVH